MGHDISTSEEQFFRNENEIEVQSSFLLEVELTTWM